jgi:hypothetical protein
VAIEDYKNLLPAWLRDNPELLISWEEGVAAVGYDNALEWVQQTPQYDLVFPGNRREDGSLRLTENEYFSTMDSYEASLRSVGVNPEMFGEQFISLIVGDVSGSEFWQERVSPIYDRIIDRGEEMIARYANDYGLAMTRESLIASLLDPEMEVKILNRQIGVTEIRVASDRTLGAAVTDRYADLTNELYERDIELGRVQQLFQQADVMMPVLQVLARRHADPDDTFDLEEFTQGSLYNDPQQARRMRRLVSQEQSTFTGGKQIEYAAGKSGGLTGLDTV